MISPFHLLILMALTVGGLHAQTPYQPDAHTLFLYHFDEMDGAGLPLDSSGNSRDASSGNLVATGLPSLPNLGSSVMTANSLEGRIIWKDLNAGNGQDSFLYQLPTGEFTIEAWVKPTKDFESFQSGNRVLVVIQPEGTPDVDLIFSVLATKGNHYLALGNSKGPNVVWTHGAPLNWEVGQWYHVAVTAKNDTYGDKLITFFNNKVGDPATPGALASTKVRKALEPQTKLSQPRTLEIGNYYGNRGQSFFPGQIDEVRISDIARTEFETLAQ